MAETLRLHVRAHPDRLVLTVSILASIAVALIVGGFLSEIVGVRRGDIAYLTGGVIGFAAGFGVGWITSRVVDRALR